ncbi:MAG: hypothetical protein ACOCV2_02435, partial [Persicimonas sp.]
MSGKTFKWTIVLIVLAGAIYALIPTVLDGADGTLDNEVEHFEGPAVEWIMDKGKPLTLGLDLQGGLLLQYRVMVDKAVQDKLDRTARDIEGRLKDEGDDVEVEVDHPSGETHINIDFADAEDRSLIDDDFMSYFSNFEQSDRGESRVRLAMTEDYLEETREFALEQAIETIRERVDALGVAEPSITRRGESDIVVQLPGLKSDDVDRAKDLIGQTAQLEFKMVDDEGTNEFFQSVADELPEDFNLRRIGGGYLSVTHQDK